jgi:hypothetical protein
MCFVTYYNILTSIIAGHRTFLSMNCSRGYGSVLKNLMDPEIKLNGMAIMSSYGTIFCTFLFRIKYNTNK